MIGGKRRPFWTNFLDGLLCERGRNATAIFVVVPHHLIDRPKLAAADVRDLFVSVFAGHVDVGNERHVLTKIVTGGVLETLEQAVVGFAIQVHALIPGNLACLGQRPSPSCVCP